MDFPYWQKQQTSQPLFEDLLWSRPERKALAGKLAIIGGSSHGFAAPAEAYQIAEEAGAGHVRVLLPDDIKKVVGGFIETAEFAPSTPSGSFSTKATAEMLDLAQWSDGLLLPGDFGRNSETAIATENLLTNYTGPIVLCKEAVDYYLHLAKTQPRPLTVLVPSFAQLQKLGINTGFTKPFVYSMGLVALVSTLHEFTQQSPLTIALKHHDSIVVACNGEVTTTKLAAPLKTWRVRTGAYSAVWLLQNPSKPFESITTAAYAMITQE